MLRLVLRFPFRSDVQIMQQSLKVYGELADFGVAAHSLVQLQRRENVICGIYGSRLVVTVQKYVLGHTFSLHIVQSLAPIRRANVALVLQHGLSMAKCGAAAARRTRYRSRKSATSCCILMRRLNCCKRGSTSLARSDSSSRPRGTTLKSVCSLRPSSVGTCSALCAAVAVTMYILLMPTPSFGTLPSSMTARRHAGRAGSTNKPCFLTFEIAYLEAGPSDIR